MLEAGAGAGNGMLFALGTCCACETTSCNGAFGCVPFESVCRIEARFNCGLFWYAIALDER